MFSLPIKVGFFLVYGTAVTVDFIMPNGVTILSTAIFKVALNGINSTFFYSFDNSRVVGFAILPPLSKSSQSKK